MYTVISASHRVCMSLISFSWHTAATKMASTILNRCDDSGQLCLFPDCRGIALDFSPFILMLAIGLLHNDYIMSIKQRTLPKGQNGSLKNGKGSSATSHLTEVYF